jgi:hypothetical protein
MPYSSEGRWSRWAVVRWILWALGTLGVFAYLEWRGLKREGDAHPPLTYVLRRYVPAWGLFLGLGGFIGWFAWHMVVTYLT